MNNKQILSALSMDLKRIALGLHRGSDGMAGRFQQEAEKRLEEVDKRLLPPYMKQTMGKINSTLSIHDNEKKSEDTLMYSTIVQNYVLYK